MKITGYQRNVLFDLEDKKNGLSRRDQSILQCLKYMDRLGHFTGTIKEGKDGEVAHTVIPKEVVIRERKADLADELERRDKHIDELFYALGMTVDADIEPPLFGFSVDHTGELLKQWRAQNEHKRVVSVSQITANGFWLHTYKKDFYVSRDNFPWFKNATDVEVQDVEVCLCVYDDQDETVHWRSLDLYFRINSMEDCMRAV